MNIKINQDNTKIEINVDDNVVETLYQKFKDKVSYNQDDLIGNIQIMHGYEDAINFLNSNYSKFNVNGKQNPYIRFVDKVVEQFIINYLTNNTSMHCDGIGLTQSDLDQITQAIHVNFRNNKDITRFPEFNKLTNFKVINGSCFEGCNNLEEINLSNITSISGNRVFVSTKISTANLINCESITGTSSFSACSSLTTVNAPILKTISGSSTFSECSSLTTINLPLLETFTGTNTFQNCSSLASISLPQSITNLPNATFYGCTSLTSFDASNIQTCGDYVFKLCSSLTTITGLTNILLTKCGHSMFGGCTNLQFPETININSEYIGVYAFSRCNINKVNIGSNCNKLYNGAFNECTNLTTVQGLENIEYIGANMFYNCENLEGVINLSNVKGWVSGRYDNIAVGGPGYMFNNCKKITKIIIGNIPGISSNSYNTERNDFFNNKLLHTVDIAHIDNIFVGSIPLFGYNESILEENCSSPNMQNFVIRNTDVVPTISIDTGRMTEEGFTWRNISGWINSFAESHPELYNKMKIYVDDSLLNNYKTADFWRRIADHIYPLSEYVPIED